MNETTTLMQFATVTLMCVFSAYQNELRAKTDIVQMAQIQKMNDDLKNILINFPEGIVLYDEGKDEVVLANLELRRIYKCSQIALQNENTMIGNKIKKVLMFPVNILQENNQQQAAQLNLNKQTLV